ncbi:MAG: hypothetical protein QMC96_01830 [Methanomicrobiales archaeon]|nr:hypothetical protein [Methanomicrobiales archaeon]
MATDVYLKWDGKDEDAFQRKWLQKGDYNAGDIGYLHAHGNMVNEIRILHRLFPPEYWDALEPIPYDFEANWSRLETWARVYLAAALTGRVIDPHREGVQDLHGFCVLLSEFLQGLEQDAGIDTAATLPGDLNYSVMWLNSLYNFFHLGFTLQKSGRDPKIFIC